GAPTITASASGLTPASQQLVVRDPPTSLVFLSTPPASIRGGSCLAATVEARRGSVPTPVAADTGISLTASADARFFTDSTCSTSAVNAVVLNGGAANVTFFMKPLTGTSLTVSATAPFGSAMQTLNVLPITRRGTCDFQTRTPLADGGVTNDLSRTCSFSPPVSDLNASFLVSQTTAALVGTELGSAEVRCRLASTSTVSCFRRQDESPASIYFQVSEVPSGMLVQRTSSFSCPATVTLTTPVTPSKSFVLKSAASSSNTFDDDDTPVVELVSGTQLALSNTACSGLDVQVVQWDGVTVARSSVDGGLPDAGLSFTVGAPPAGLNRMALVQPGVISTDRPVCGLMLRGSTSSPAAIALTRGAGDAGCPLQPVEFVLSERIDFGSKASVREYSATFAPGVATRDVSIAPVDVTRTVVLASTQMAGGQGTGETDTASNARFTESAFHLVLTNSTTVSARRAETTSTAAVTFYVLELVP
ncbi:MAG: hypothetical protein ACOZQL_29995, partial [Myxococcota bacterium]